MKKLNVWILDIETAPIVASVWGTKDQNIAINQIVRDSFVMGWAAKRLGDPASKTIYMDQRNAKNISDDRAILRPLWKILNEADILITQNGKNFDCPRLNARFIHHGWLPPADYQHIDTYQIARRVAKFTSNKLEFLTGTLCTKYKKLLHKNFPGMELWNECLKGNRKAWAEMKTYNIHDVLATEELYTKLRAWVPQTMPVPHWADDLARDCGTCGVKGRITPNGVRVTRNGRYNRYRCLNCGANTHGRKLK